MKQLMLIGLSLLSLNLFAADFDTKVIYDIYEGRFTYKAINPLTREVLTIKKRSAHLELTRSLGLEERGVKKLGTAERRFLETRETRIHQQCYKLYDVYQVKQMIEMRVAGALNGSIQGKLISTDHEYLGNNGKCIFR